MEIWECDDDLKPTNLIYQTREKHNLKELDKTSLSISIIMEDIDKLIVLTVMNLMAKGKKATVKAIVKRIKELMQDMVDKSISDRVVRLLADFVTGLNWQGWNYYNEKTERDKFVSSVYFELYEYYYHHILNNLKDDEDKNRFFRILD